MAAHPRRPRGFSVLGMALALALAAMAAIWASSRQAQRIEDAAAHSAGVWLAQIRQAVSLALSSHFTALAAGEAPLDAQGRPLFVDPQVPTMEELRAAGFLPAGFPERSAMGFAAQLRIARGTACPGAQCRLDGLVYSAQPVLKRGTQLPDLTAMAVIIEAAGGYGGAVWPAAPAQARGAAFDFGNPLEPGGPAYAPGTLALWAGAGAGTGGADLDRYVKIGDTRDPQLEGTLSVASSVSAGGHLSVGARAAAGKACGVAIGTMASSARGELLTCQAGAWAPASGGFGGAYSLNYPRGCYHYSGVSTANPRTGGCSCPAGYSAVIVSAGGKWTDTEGWTTGYVCVR
ncbi:prepilin [Achromobacter denitrificans]